MLAPDSSLASAEVISAFADMDLMMMIKMVQKSNPDT